MTDQYKCLWHKAIKRAGLPETWMEYYDAAEAPIREVLGLFGRDVTGYIKAYGADRTGTDWVDEYVGTMTLSVAPK